MAPSTMVMGESLITRIRVIIWVYVLKIGSDRPTSIISWLGKCRHPNVNAKSSLRNSHPTKSNARRFIDLNAWIS